MERVKAFLKRKQVVISVQTYLIDALGAMASRISAKSWETCCSTWLSMPR